MGDVLSLIERAEQAIDETARAARAEDAVDDFLEDFRWLLTIKKMGPLEQVVGMIPGSGPSQPNQRGQVDDKQLGRIEAIIGSMTPGERRNHGLINGSRRKRIARGSGTSVEEINRLLKQFVQMRKMLKMMSGASGGGRKGRQRLMDMMKSGRV
jgi:signal recognition particle subunit SRP54